MAGPYEGVRVVEVGQFIAVPYCAQLLSDGGADVVKVEPPGGDPTRTNSPTVAGEGRQFLNKNRGKRSIALDLSAPAGQEILVDLARSADVVLVNGRPGWSSRMGLGVQLAEDNPRVVVAECSAFGGRGPMAGLPGVDVVLQAHAGLVHQGQGGPELLGNPVIDYSASLLLAFGVATALFHRERHGTGQRIDVSLLQAALVLQNNAMFHADGSDGEVTARLEPIRAAVAAAASWQDVVRSVRRAGGPVPIQAYYGIFPTAGGWVAIGGARPQIQRRVARALGIDDPWVDGSGWSPEDPAIYLKELRAEIERRLATDSARSWVERLREADVPAAVVQLPEELLGDEQVVANDFLVRQTHPVAGALLGVGPPLTFDRTPFQLSRPAPGLSEHAREVLTELDMPEHRVDELIEQGVVVPPAGGAPEPADRRPREL